MNCKGLKLNSILEIMWEDEVYNSNVQDIDEKHIAISIPMKAGKYLPLNAGTNVVVRYYDQSAVYKFKTIVQGRKKERVPVLIIEFPKKVVRVQRRQFVRIETMSELEYIKLKNEDKYNNVEKLRKKEWLLKKAILTNISGGGIQFVTKEEVKLGELMFIKLPLKNEEVAAIGKVVRAQKNNVGKYTCGVNFMEIDKKYREKIILYVFELMREQRRKS